MLTKLQTLLCVASVLVTGCRFFPEQLILPEQPASEQGDGGATMSRRDAISSGGRGAAAASQIMQSASMSSLPAAGGGGGGGGGAKSNVGSASLDAGIKGDDASKGMSSTGSTEQQAAGSGGSGRMDAGSGSPVATSTGAQDPTCDFSGVWITKQVAVTLALDEPQFMNNWAYYEIEQSGADFTVTKHIDCGAEVLGSGSVEISRATLTALVQRNMQNGRKGHFRLQDGKCALDIANFWSVRGAEETRFLPNPTRDSTMTMAELIKMNPLPNPRMPDGAEDIDGDGELGAAAQINGIISGVRNSCQRDWDHWFTAPGYEVTPNTDFTSDLKLRIEYETDESVMSPTSGLLTTATENTNDWDHIMYFRFLGRSTDDPRAQSIERADPVETCYAIQKAMPAEQLKR